MADATHARFIPGIYNYCDRWCERCRFAERCYSRALRLRFEDALARGLPPEFTHEPPEEVEVPADNVARPWLAELERAQEESDPEELERILKQHDADDVRAREDPLVRQTAAYRDQALHFVRALGTVRHESQDPIVSAALEVIEAQAWAMSGKMFRAVRGLFDRDLDDDPLEVQTDANGSAKLMRLLIAESRSAWEVLTSVGHAVADGVPVRMMSDLLALDRDVASRFPRAMAFVRPGFDTEPAD
jgi:hypothetical protein